jgi:hypothetical protein
MRDQDEAQKRLDPRGCVRAAEWRGTAGHIPNDRAMPNWRLRLVAGQMPSLRDLRQHSA